MRVLLTRAAQDAAGTQAALEAEGHLVLVSPVIKIETRGEPWPGGVVDGVLATSRHAFGVATRGGPSAEARRLTPLWLVGGKTEAAARDQGFTGAAFVAPNAVALAFAMGKGRRHNRFVYLAGRDRKPDLETALKVTEQTIEVLEIYEALPAHGLEPATMAAIASGTIDAVLHFSRRSATLFASLVQNSGLPSGSLHACLSEDVAEPLSALGWRTMVAAQPNETSLIETLKLT